MKACPTCDGAITRCPVCRHYHCDEDCRPVECIQAEEEQ